MLLTGAVPRRGRLTHFMDDAELGSDLISYYACDNDATNTTVTDSASHAAGTATANTSTYSCTGPTSLLTKGFEWTAATQGFTANIDNPAKYAFQIGQALSINQWLYIPDITDYKYKNIISTYTASYNGFCLLTCNNQIWFNYHDGTDATRAIIAAVDVTAGNWHMVSFSYDGRTSSPALGINAYVDGSSVSIYRASQGTGAFTSATTTKIGMTSDYTNYAGFIGKQAALGFWRKEISSGGFLKLWNDGDGLPY